MKKSAIDLSLVELAAMGANAALRASDEAREAGLPVVGVADVRQGDCVFPTLLQRRPSGLVTRPDRDRADPPAVEGLPEISKRVDD